MVISISIIPQLVRSVRRIKVAQRMRGINQTSLRNWRYIAAPVIEESLERAINLAANLESNGFGYHKKPTTYSAMNIGFSEKTILLSALFLFLISFSDLTQINILAIALLITVLSIVQIHSSNFAFLKKLTTKNQLARSR
jgi:energy-coupling factor transporter transmembrane protein EcfT